MWLGPLLAPEFKPIADFRRDNGPAIKKVGAQLVELCRRMNLLSKASVVIDGSKFKAVNNRDKSYSIAKVERRRKQLEQSIARNLSRLDTADLQELSETITLKKTRLTDKLEKLKSEVAKLVAIEKDMPATPNQQISLIDSDSRSCRRHASGMIATSGRGFATVERQAYQGDVIGGGAPSIFEQDPYFDAVYGNEVHDLGGGSYDIDVRRRAHAAN